VIYGEGTRGSRQTPVASDREKDPNILTIKRCAIFNSHWEKIVDFYPMASGLAKLGQH
jgi:hypothetical protein